MQWYEAREGAFQGCVNSWVWCSSRQMRVLRPDSNSLSPSLLARHLPAIVAGEKLHLRGLSRCLARSEHPLNGIATIAVFNATLVAQAETMSPPHGKEQHRSRH